MLASKKSLPHIPGQFLLFLTPCSPASIQRASRLLAADLVPLIVLILMLNELVQPVNPGWCNAPNTAAGTNPNSPCFRIQSGSSTASLSRLAAVDQRASGLVTAEPT